MIGSSVVRAPRGQPVGSVALAALIFGESPSPLQLSGVVLVLAALLAASRADTGAGALAVPERSEFG